MRRNSAQIAIETLEGRRLMDGTLPPPDGNPPPDNQIVAPLGRGHSPVIVTIDNPDLLDDPNERLLTPGGKIVALPAASLKGILRATDDPND
jgi:hypothetical protein